jgi:hypothetical protein
MTRVVFDQQSDALPWFQFVKLAAARASGDGPVAVIVASKVSHAHSRQHVFDRGDDRRCGEF